MGAGCVECEPAETSGQGRPPTFNNGQESANMGMPAGMDCSLSDGDLCSTAVALRAALQANERLEIVIHGIRRMAESGCTLDQIIDVCEAEFPEPPPRNGE